MTHLFGSEVDTLVFAENLKFERLHCFITLCVVADDSDWTHTACVEFVVAQVDRSFAGLGAHTKYTTDLKLKLLFKVDLWEMFLFRTKEERLRASELAYSFPFVCPLVTLINRG